MCSDVAALPCPYGDGRTGERVSRLLRAPATAALLRLDEPDFVDRALPVDRTPPVDLP